MKVALILGTNIWFSPYVSIYTRFLDVHGINYDIISWSRDGSKEDGISFEQSVSSTTSKFKKLSLYFLYISFVKEKVKEGNYDKLIVFTPQIAIYLSLFLKRNYRNRYIFDFRDLSIEQNSLLKPFFRRVLKNSYANVISSPGFKKYLPTGYDYLISHNFNVDDVKTCLSSSHPNSIALDKQVILTIGGIRDYVSNSMLLGALANKSQVQIQFIGKGPAVQLLQNYAEKNGVKNIVFEGYYPKEKEKEYIKKCTYMNIFYPRKPSHDTALSNRFYNSLIYKRPMIVTYNTIQGDYVEKYQVGLSIIDCSGLSEKLQEWYKMNDYKDFCERCNFLLREFLVDQKAFEVMLDNFLQTNVD